MNFEKSLLVKLIRIGALAGLLAAPMAGLAATDTKADNTDSLDQAISWIGDTAPGNGDIALWSGSYAVASLGAAMPGSALSWDGIGIGAISGAGAATLVSIGGTGSATTGSALTIGTNGIDMSAASTNVVINSATVAFSGNQIWNVASGLNLRFGTTGTGAANATAVTSGNDGVVTVSGGVVDLNEGGSIGFSDAGGFTGFSGSWMVNAGATLRGLRNGATAFGSNTATNAITLNGGTLAVGGISGSQGNWTWTTPITLAAGASSTIDNQIYSGSSRTLLLNGTIGGSGNLSINNTGPGTMTADTGFILAATNTMSGTVTINSGAFLRVGGLGGLNTGIGAGSLGTLGTAGIVNNGTLTLSHSNAWTFVNAVSGTGSVRVGGAVSGAGSQAVSLTGMNSYTGATTVGAGTLEVDGAIAGGSAVTVQTGATLDGNGNLSGPVVISGGGTLAAGTSTAIGTLSIGNLLTLSATSTNVMRLEKTGTTLTNDLIQGLTGISYGGTLVVITNAGSPLALGDTFTLFQSAAYSGGFGAYVLPALPPGWTWDTSQMTVNGSLTVAAALTPAITAVSPASGATPGGTAVTITGSNFVAGASVNFGGTAAASVTFNSSSQLTAITPALSAGVLNVQVTNPNGQSATATNAFTVFWTPAPSSVYAWFAGDSGLAVGVDNYNVTTWTNLGFAGTNSADTQAGRNLVNLTGAPQELYLQTAAGNPAGAVVFGGSGGTDGIWAAKGSFGILTNDYTIIACVLVSNAAPEGFLFDSTSMTPGYTRALVWSNNWQVSVNSGAGTITAPASTNVWQIHSFVIGTNSGTPLFQHFINGTQVGSVAISSPDYLSGLMIGANVSQTDGIQADVAEFLVFNSALNNATRASVESYLSNKWTGVTAATNAPTPPTPYVYTPVFVSGATNGYGVTNGVGYPIYRIPSMVTTTDGTVIAACDGRQGNGDPPNPIDCVCRRSFDNGNTWGPLQVIADYGSNQNSNDVDTYPAYGITNPIPRTSASGESLLVDRTNGRVWLIYDNAAPATNRFNSETSAFKLELRYSDDDGATWSPRVDVEALNPGLRPPLSYAPEVVTGPGNGIQLAYGTNAGRLIFPIYIYSGPNYSSRLIYSDDHGATWQLGGTSGLGGDENQDVETSNGGLLASMRDGVFPWQGVRTFSRSADGGITWGGLFTNTVPVIPDPTCQASILRLTTTNDSNASRIVFANCDSSSSRVAMTLRISYDEGQTWPVSNLVYSGVSGYSSLTKLANGYVGLLNEVNSYARIDFVSRSVSVISGGTDTNLIGAASFLNMNISPAAGTNPPTLSFSALSNNTYTVQYCTNLAAGGWQRFMDVAAQTSNAIVQIPVGSTNAMQFFRLLTPQLP